MTQKDHKRDDGDPVRPDAFGRFPWETAARRLLRAEIVREGLTVKKLVVRMQRLGIEETEASIKNKVSRGTFSFAFFLQAMRALGHPTIDVSLVLPPEMPSGKGLDPPVQKARSAKR